MTDSRIAANPLFLREEELRQGIEMLFFAYRDFTGKADRMLAEYGFGRAHHRAIYFIGRQPGMTVSALLDILKITKQSLNRVLGELIRRGFVDRRAGARDRRQRLLELSPKGAELERRLSDAQRVHLADAYRAAGADPVEGFRRVLLGLIDEPDRVRFAQRAPPGRR